MCVSASRWRVSVRVCGLEKNRKRNRERGRNQSTFTGEFNIHNGWQVDGLVRDKFVCFYFCWFLPSSALSYVWLCSFTLVYLRFCVVIFISVCRYMHGSFDSIQTCFYDGSSECLTYLVHMYLFVYLHMYVARVKPHVR